jgi:hypothetical protein
MKNKLKEFSPKVLTEKAQYGDLKLLEGASGNYNPNNNKSS